MIDHSRSILTKTQAGNNFMLHPITPTGSQVLNRRIKFLMGEKRENLGEIRRAVARGDLSENAEYEAARARQRIIYTELHQLRDYLDRSYVVDCRNHEHRGVAVFGCTVHLESQNTVSPDKVYIILTMLEAMYLIKEDIIQEGSYLSIYGGISQGLIGKPVGHSVRFKSLHYILRKIEYTPI